MAHHLRIGNFHAAALVFPLWQSTRGADVSDQTDLIQGTLDLLITSTIALEPMHGWAIAQRMQQISDELLKVQQGSLYPALHRRARFYSPTKAGRKQLETEVSKWARVSAGVNLVLEET